MKLFGNMPAPSGTPSLLQSVLAPTTSDGVVHETKRVSAMAAQANLTQWGVAWECFHGCSGHAIQPNLLRARPRLKTHSASIAL